MHTTQDHALSRADTDFSNRHRRRVMPDKKKPIIHNPFLRASFAFVKKCEKNAKKQEANAIAHNAIMAELESKAEEFRKDISVAFGGTVGDGEPKTKKIRKGKLTLDSDSDDDKLEGLSPEEVKKIKDEADKEAKKIQDEVDKEMKLMDEAEDNQCIKWAINKLMFKNHGIYERDSLRADIHKESKSIAIKFFTAKYDDEDKESKIAQLKTDIEKIDLSNIKKSTGSISVAMDNLSNDIDRNHEYIKELAKHFKVGAVKYLTDKYGEEHTKEFMAEAEAMAHKRKMKNVDVRPEAQLPQDTSASAMVDLTASAEVDLTASDGGN